MTKYELTIRYEGLGIKEVEVSAGELAKWLNQFSKDVWEGRADNILEFKVEKKGE